MIIKLLLSLLLLGILVFVVGKAVNLQDLPATLWAFPRQTLIELLIISLLISTLKAWRFLILLRNTNITVSFWVCLKTFIAGQAITPLPGGEAIRGVFLKHEIGTNILKTTGPVVTQAYLELASAAILMMVGALMFQLLRIPALIVLISLLFVALVLNNQRILTTLYQKLGRVKFVGSFLNRLRKSQADIKANFYDPKSHLPDKVLVRSLALSLISHLFGGLLVFLSAQAYNTNLDYLKSIFIYTSGLVIQGIGTISPGGIGLTEGGMTGILLLSGVKISTAVAIVLIFRTITLVFNIILGLIFISFFYFKPLLMSKKLALK